MKRVPIQPFLVYRNSVSGCPPYGYGLKRIQLSKQSKRGKLAASSERTGQKQMPQNTSLILRAPHTHHTHHTHTHTIPLLALSPSLLHSCVFSFCLMCRATEESENFSIFAFFSFLLQNRKPSINCLVRTNLLLNYMEALSKSQHTRVDLHLWNTAMCHSIYLINLNKMV